MVSTKAKGYFLGAVAAVSYGLNPLFALPLYADGMAADSVLFWRYLVAIPLMALMIKMRGRSFKVSWKQMSILVVLGLIVALSSLMLFMSYNYMDVGIASTMLFVYPIMVALIMALFFKERVSKPTIVSIIMATGGIGLLFQPSEGAGAGLSVIGLIMVMISALSYAIYIVAVNKSSLCNVATLAVTFYVLLFGLLLFAGRLINVGHIEMPSADNSYLWGCVAGLAIFPTAISFACTTGAIQYIGSTPTAILGALEPVTGVVVGVAVFGEQLTASSFFGLLLILVAVIMVIAGPKLSVVLTHVHKMFPRLHHRR